MSAGPGERAAPRQFGLLRERRFAPFFVTQFLGALNDNIFKQALFALVTFQAATITTLAPALAVNIGHALFILPFFLFSAIAGQLADKYEKVRVIRAVKVFEILIMAVGAAGFILHDATLLFGALFMLGLHSTVFGPVKYSILPQHLRRDELVGGNALVESGTFLAIIVGTIAGNVVTTIPSGVTFWIPLVTIGLAAAGYATAVRIPAGPAADPALRIDWNPVSGTVRAIRYATEDRVVFKSILGISWFWFFGAMFLAQIPIYGKDVLGGGTGIVTVMFVVFAVAIAAGSLCCERLSGHKVEIGLVPFGSIGLTLFGIDLWFASPATAVAADVDLLTLLARFDTWRVLFDLFMIGLFGGFFIVPLYALIQSRAAPAQQSRIIAANNILNALFMVVAALLAIGLLALGASVPDLFLATALLNSAVAVYIYRQVPEFLVRFLAWLLIHTVYRLEKSGLDHIPEEGPALLVCNHVSFVDAVVIMAAVRRPVRFVMDHHIFRTPILNFIFREGRAIPIAPARESPETLDRAYDTIAQALAAGEVVGIFPEGRITDTGEMYPFRSGVRRILDRTPVPVVPLALRGLWGALFSRAAGRAMSRLFQRGLLPRIALVAGPVWTPEQVTPEALQIAVQRLRGDWR